MPVISRAALRPVALLAWVAAGLVGCAGVPYVLHLAEGQLRIQGHVETIDEVLASGRLSADDADKLRLIVKARQFAVDRIGLTAGRSYTTFYDTAGDPLAWNLSAARRDKLVARTWQFPVVGEVPYLSFFDEDYLHRYEQQLIDEGYDTLTYELDAYSTLGLFDDPVRSTMLRRGTLSLSETIIHELLHNTIYRAGEADFNESLATFVGRQGAIEFLRAEFGEDSGWPRAAVNYYADTDAVNAFLLELYADLAVFYARAISADEKIAGREVVFQAARDRFVAEVRPTLNYPEVFDYLAELPTNNAWVLGHYRYNLNLDVFAEVYVATGRAWPTALAVYRAAAAASGDPFEHLQRWLAKKGSGVFFASPVICSRDIDTP
ncbi:MAG: aminopeptidase [Planctomycetota bacterium]